MILGMGIDSVEINRFAHWHNYTSYKLQRVFAQSEIPYCLSNPSLSAQRFAVRFAAREALFKALSQVFPAHSIPLLTLCRATTIERKAGCPPTIILDWPLLTPFGVTLPLKSVTVWLSMTHTGTMATSMIILEKSEEL